MAPILGTGPLLAAMDEDEPNHRSCVHVIRRVREQLVVPAPVLVELDYWLLSRGFQRTFGLFLSDVANGLYQVVDLEPSDYRRVQEIVRQYEDSRIGFVDAAVLAIVERLNEPKLATLDHRTSKCFGRGMLLCCSFYRSPCDNHRSDTEAAISADGVGRDGRLGLCVR